MSKVLTDSERARFEFDLFGREVLVGLTYAETLEFDSLEGVPLAPEIGMNWQTLLQAGGAEARWVMLFTRHLKALNDRIVASNRS